jgi:hypothetical protein
MLACLWRFDVRHLRVRTAVAKSSLQRDRALALQVGNVAVEHRVDWAEAARTRSAHPASGRRPETACARSSWLGPRPRRPHWRGYNSPPGGYIYTVNDINRFEGTVRAHPQFGETGMGSQMSCLWTGASGRPARSFVACARGPIGASARSDRASGLRRQASAKSKLPRSSTR